jgi:hypothetical protein
MCAEARAPAQTWLDAPHAQCEAVRFHDICMCSLTNLMAGALAALDKDNSELMQCHYVTAPADIYSPVQREALEAKFANMHVLMFDVMPDWANKVPPNWHYIPYKHNWHYVPARPGREVAIASGDLDDSYYAPTARIARPPASGQWRPDSLVKATRPLLAAYGSMDRDHPDPKKAWMWNVKLQARSPLLVLAIRELCCTSSCVHSEPGCILYGQHVAVLAYRTSLALGFAAVS